MERQPVNPSTAAVVLGFSESATQAREFGHCAGLEYRQVERHRFPDGESRIRVPTALPPRVYLFLSLYQPNDKLIEILLAGAAAREQGAVEVHLIAPYLCYMRQDMAFHPGEAVSQRIIGQMLAASIDGIISVDPHLHRIERLEQAVPVKHAQALSAAPILGEFVARRLPKPFLLGPDAESEQWIRQAAEPLGLDHAIAHKQRLGDQSVRITLPEADYTDRHIVILDDIASTGRTLEAAARELQAHRPASISVAVTHALFLEDALERLATVGIVNIWSSDSIPHTTNAIPLAPLLTTAFKAPPPLPLHHLCTD